MLTLDKIYHASYVLKDVIRPTHLVKAQSITDECDIYLKPENLQITGSFKVRGSGYKISQLSDEEKKLVLRYKLSERQARALLRLQEEKRLPAIEYIGSNQLNTVQTDSYIEELLREKPKPKIQRRWGFRAVNLYINSFNKT